MAVSTLQSLLRDPKSRVTDRDTFVQVLVRLSSYRDTRDGEERKPVKVAEKAA